MTEVNSQIAPQPTSIPAPTIVDTPDTIAPVNGFAALGLAEPILRALATEGYSTPTPIQTQAIGPLLAGRDLLGIAQTGTGKTAAFGLPLLQRLAENRQRPLPKTVRALILAPTRELAIQIEESLRSYGRHLPLSKAAVYGGVGFQPQIKAVARGLDILVATPGRLMDLVRRGHLKLEATQVLVLDEADRMLDMGFVQEVRRIVAMLPRQRQSLLFSATMPPDIAQLAQQMLIEPLRVEVTPEVVTVEKIRQQIHFVEPQAKRDLLVEVLGDAALARVIVFTRTKHGADRVARHLERAGIAADAIHGDKAQNARQRALQAFREGRVRVLVATDIAARGIDVDGVTHVINFELPNIPESYVHRIGRTARAGAEGAAISFCSADERPYLRDIERLTRVKIQVAGGDAEWSPLEAPRPQQRPGHRPQGQRPQGQRPQGQRPQGQRPQHARPQQERSHQERPYQERSEQPQRAKKPHHRGQAPKPADVQPAAQQARPQQAPQPRHANPAPARFTPGGKGGGQQGAKRPQGRASGPTSYGGLVANLNQRSR